MGQLDTVARHTLGTGADSPPARRARSVGTPAYRYCMITPDAAPTAPGSAARPDRPFSTTDFVVVDLETTGWDPQAARITEIAAARISGGDLRQVFSSLVAPGCPIPGQVAALTGITDALVAGAPEIAAVLPGFLEFARGAVLIAHNAPFDIGFLRAACRQSGLDWPDFTVLDTVAVARAALRPGEVPDCKLATLARYFGTAVRPSHRALADALATAGVLEALLARLAAAGVRTLAEISRQAEASAAAWAPRAGQPARGRRFARLRRWARRLARLAGGVGAGAGG